MTTSNTTILIRKSVISGNTPSELANGEIAINTADGKLFYADPVGNILNITNQNTFGTVNANSTLIIASNSTDTLSLVAGENIRIDGDGINKQITISAISTDTFTDGVFSGDVIANNLLANTSMSIGGVSNITSNSFTTTSTSQIPIDIFSITNYRSAKYEVQITSGSDYHVIELRALHDSTNVWLAQYGEITTNGSLGSFDASIVSGDFQLLFTPTNSSTIIRFYRTTLTI
jgi:hypothetical protein